MAANATGPDCERSARSIIAVKAKRPVVGHRAIVRAARIGHQLADAASFGGRALGEQPLEVIFVHREDQVERTEILVADAPRAQARQLIAAPPRMGLAALIRRVADVIA